MPDWAILTRRLGCFKYSWSYLKLPILLFMDNTISKRRRTPNVSHVQFILSPEEMSNTTAEDTRSQMVLLMYMGPENVTREFAFINGSNSSTEISFPECTIQGYVHIVVGILMSMVFLLGTIGNVLVIAMFYCFNLFRKPITALLINLALVDLISAFIGSPIVAISSFYGEWVFGKFGCQAHAFIMGYSGMVSIGTLTAIALERFFVVASYNCESPMRRLGTALTIVIVWVYGIIWVLPPLFGWGQFTIEKYGTSCSFNYVNATAGDRSFLLFIFTGGFLVPSSVIVLSYLSLGCSVIRDQCNFKRQAARMKTSVQLMRRNSQSHLELRVSRMCATLVLVFLCAWLPYASVTMTSVFGSPTQQKYITPIVCIFPAIFAKSSTAYNPIVYVLSHRPFRNRLRRLVFRNSAGDSSQHAKPIYPQSGITGGSTLRGAARRHTMAERRTSSGNKAMDSDDSIRKSPTLRSAPRHTQSDQQREQLDGMEHIHICPTVSLLPGNIESTMDNLIDLCKCKDFHKDTCTLCTPGEELALLEEGGKQICIVQSNM